MNTYKWCWHSRHGQPHMPVAGWGGIGQLPQEPTQAMLGIEPSSSQQTERGFCAFSSPPASHPGSDFGICRMEHPEQHPQQEGMGGGHRLMQCSPDIHQEGKSGF